MRRRSARRARHTAVALGLGLLVGLGPAAAAWAGSCGKLRSFAGVVTQASGRAISVERGGRSTSFQKASGAKVIDESGSGVSAWGGLRKGLRVKVCWGFDDEPRAARRVFVVGH